ncbi:uncharacterized protein F5Z01DRAFT_738767 [Emericellopsis atlantica]|uniref:Uncharacterized protein n=1 Tax=Emericellopsis atlantica TaxID=2614577 RepID=A0A9P8CMD2_9HYPO|nr:uncharacterized protein F5Z01DRAFT_738767 [Emericellopsis atlantica]KAG9251895.1 hypothetical protein F5Z01DRAFT_738767 [Emericellopsis atlantica]
MRYSTILATASAVFAPLAAADWGWPEDPFVLQKCAATCNGLAPTFSRDKVTDYCNALVNDGCHQGVVSLFPGSVTFAANRDIDCKETGPRDLLQCQEGIETAVLNTPRWGGPGGTAASQMYVYNHYGQQAGAIGITSGCLPIDPLNLGAC